LLAAGTRLPVRGSVFISVRDEDKPAILPLARRLAELQFEIHSTGGTADFLNRQGLKVTRINKVSEGSPHCVDAIREGKFSFVINTTADEMAVVDSFTIRRAALERRVPYSTVLSSARAMLHSIEELRNHPGSTWSGEVFPL